jgi:nucleotide-binding universal stress UspA family protein
VSALVVLGAGARAALVWLAPAAALLALLHAAPVAAAGWEEIGFEVSVPPRVETSPGDTVLVAMFRANDHERIDIGLEMARWARREIARSTDLRVLDVPPPAIPEQRPEKLAVNDVFWKRLGEDFRADIIVSGVVEFYVEDQSGFVTRDYEDPVTLQTVRRTVYLERRGFKLKVELFIIKGDNGALLLADTWSEERVLDGTAAEDLQMFYDSLEMAKDDQRAVFLPMTVREPRYLWLE